MKENNGERAIKGFLRAYMAERKLHKAVAYLDKNIQWIGTGAAEHSCTYQETVAALQEELLTEPWPYGRLPLDRGRMENCVDSLFYTESPAGGWGILSSRLEKGQQKILFPQYERQLCRYSKSKCVGGNHRMLFGARSAGILYQSEHAGLFRV